MALAFVVATKDSYRRLQVMRKLQDGYSDIQSPVEREVLSIWARRAARGSREFLAVSVLYLSIQAAIFGVSLASLAYNANELDPRLVIFAGTTSLLALAVFAPQSARHGLTEEVLRELARTYRGSLDNQRAKDKESSD
jgi:hypothetical protein